MHYSQHQIVFAILVYVVNCSYVYAVSPSIPYERPSAKQLEPLSLEPETDAPPEISLPPLPQEDDELEGLPSIFLKKITLEGNTIFSDEELLSTVNEYVNTTIKTSTLQQIRIDLTKYYVDRGYINSGVIIPDQKVGKGEIIFRVIEGELTVIQLSGQEDLHHSYIYDRIIAGLDKPLNINALQKQLFLLQQDPRIHRINAQLQPGAAQGQSVLYVDVKEAEQLKIFFTVNNHRPPSVGEERGILELRNLNLTGMGDTLQLSYGLTEGLDDFYLYYDYPLTAEDMKISFYYDESDSEVVEQPFASLDVDSQSSSAGIGLSFPVFRELDQQLEMGFNLDKRKSETFLLGEPFSFEAGPQLGLSRVTVLRHSVSWFKRMTTSVASLRSTFNFGFDAFRATVNEDNAPDTKFQSWLGQFQWLKQMSGNGSRFLSRATMQLTDDPLLPLEQFAIGGANSVRGYRENQLSGDNGVFASLEYRYPLFKQTQGGHFQIVAFADYGRIWNKGRATPNTNSIYSVGTGFRWANKKGMEFDIYWGEPLRDVDNANNSLQDDGIHLQFKIQLY